MLQHAAFLMGASVLAMTRANDPDAETHVWRMSKVHLVAHSNSAVCFSTISFMSCPCSLHPSMRTVSLMTASLSASLCCCCLQADLIQQEQTAAGTFHVDVTTRLPHTHTCFTPAECANEDLMETVRKVCGFLSTPSVTFWSHCPCTAGHADTRLCLHALLACTSLCETGCC